MVDKKMARERRGQSSTAFEASYRDLSDDRLIELLEGGMSMERTAAARILGQRKCSTALLPLCHALETETALYCRISISCIQQHG